MTTEQETVQAHPKVPTDLKPGRVFVTLDEEIDNLQAEVRRFRTDEEALEGEFTPFRLRAAGCLHRRRRLRDGNPGEADCGRASLSSFRL